MIQLIIKAKKTSPSNEKKEKKKKVKVLLKFFPYQIVPSNCICLLVIFLFFNESD